LTGPSGSPRTNWRTSGSVLAISSAGVPWATMRPPVASSMTQSLMAMHSGTSWLTTSEVAPVTSLSVRISLAATPMLIRSRPAKGSSYMMSSGSSAMARASAMRRAMPPDTSADAQAGRAAQAHGIELHQHDVADHRLGQVGVLAQREGDVVEHRQVGEQRAELEQHAQAAAQAVELGPVARFDTSPSNTTRPCWRRARRRSGAAAWSCRSPTRPARP
jgi:hypothetical protein